MIQPEWKTAFILSCEPVWSQMISFSSEKQIITFLCRNMRPETIITSPSVSSVCSFVRSAETDRNLPHLHTELTGSCYRKWPFMGIKTRRLFLIICMMIIFSDFMLTCSLTLCTLSLGLGVRRTRLIRRPAELAALHVGSIRRLDHDGGKPLG